MTTPAQPTPIDEMFKELEATPGVEFRPITDTDKQRVQALFQDMGVTDKTGDVPADDKGSK
jgi:hypothetical protein